MFFKTSGDTKGLHIHGKHQLFSYFANLKDTFTEQRDILLKFPKMSDVFK